MIRHLILGSTLVFVLAAVGCDSNPGGPSAPSAEESRKANANAPPATPGALPASRMPNRKTAVGAAPAAVD